MKQSALRLIAALTLVLTLLTVTACQTAPAENDPQKGAVAITFNGQDYTCEDASAVRFEDNALIIVKPGTYRVSGKLDNGQLRVNVSKNDRVTLIFDGVDITSKSSAPVYVKSADKVTLILTDGTENKLADASSYTFPEGETKPNACLYSSEDLTIEGSGSLIITARYNNGIGCKNDLKIKGGTYDISAVKNGIKGNDSVTVLGGKINIVRCNDGIKTDSDEDYKGVLTITGGTITIHADDDGLQASNEVLVADATVNLYVGGKTVNCDGIVSVDDGCLIVK